MRRCRRYGKPRFVRASTSCCMTEADAELRPDVSEAKAAPRTDEVQESADLAERQEGRRLGDGDVRDLAGRQRAELFGADHASEEGHRRSRRQGLVDLRRPRRRLAADADAGAARHSGDVLRQRPLHRAISRRGEADRQVRLRHRRAFLHAGRSAVLQDAGGAAGGDPPEHRHAAKAAPARRSPAGAARWWRSRRRPRASSSRPGCTGPATSPTRTCRSRSTRRTGRSPACRPRTSPTTACCAPRRAICSTCIAAPSTICARTRRIGLQTLVIHCQFGGRPLITAVLTELLQVHAEVARRLVHHARGSWPTGRSSRTSTSTPFRAGISPALQEEALRTPCPTPRPRTT